MEKPPVRPFPGASQGPAPLVGPALGLVLVSHLFFGGYGFTAGKGAGERPPGPHKETAPFPADPRSGEAAEGRKAEAFHPF